MTETPKPEPLTVVARMRARPGSEDDLREALEHLTEVTREEDGLLSYDLHVGADDPGLFVFYERWDSREAHDAHDRSSHVEQFRARIPEIVDGQPQVDRLRHIF